MLLMARFEALMRSSTRFGRNIAILNSQAFVNAEARENGLDSGTDVFNENVQRA